MRIVKKTLLCGMLMIAAGQAAEQRIARSRLPVPVRDAVDRESKGASVKGYSKEVENGKTFYEVETVRNGKSRDVLVNAAGTLVEVEEEVDRAALPEKIQTGLKRAAENQKIVKTELVTKRNSRIYEAVIQNGTKSFEIQVDSNGERVK